MVKTKKIGIIRSQVLTLFQEKVWMQFRDSMSVGRVKTASDRVRPLGNKVFKRNRILCHTKYEESLKRYKTCVSEAALAYSN
jgi:uncharacterized protein YaaR (DUF327 family)